MHVVRAILVTGFLSIPFLGLRAFGQSSDWTPLLNSKKLSCTKAKPCRITENKTHESFEMSFELREEPALNLRTITKIVFKNTKDNTTQAIELDQVGRVKSEEPFQFFSMDLRKKGLADLALLSANSPHHGPLYYYFMYDTATSKFVLNGPDIPELKPVNASHEFVSAVDSAIAYKIDDHQKLNLMDPSSSGNRNPRSVQ